MSILFYDHLFDRHVITIHIQNLDAPPEQKNKLQALADDILHHGLLEFILQKLHPHHHHLFLSQLDRAPYDPELLTYLKKYADPEIETALEKEAQRLIKLILKDLRLPKT